MYPITVFEFEKFYMRTNNIKTFRQKILFDFKYNREIVKTIYIYYLFIYFFFVNGKKL